MNKKKKIFISLTFITGVLFTGLSGMLFTGLYEINLKDGYLTVSEVLSNSILMPMSGKM